MSGIGSGLRASIVLLALFSILLGGLYPLLVTVSAQILFPSRSNGSLVLDDGKPVGSQLLGQSFTRPDYFWGRPSATLPPYNPVASGASNYSPANPKLQEAVNARLAMLHKYAHDPKLPVPVDLVTASASGLDPHISLEGALYQLPRIAKERRIAPERLKAMIEEMQEQEWPGSVARVNVLKLNLELDRYKKQENR